MTLPSLASNQDIADRLGRALTPAEITKVDALLADASALIRDETRQDLTAVTAATVTVESPTGPWLDLPQRPVTAVTTVSINGQQVTDYQLLGDRLHRVYGWAWPSVDTIPPMAIYGTLSTVTVVYDHGAGAVPPQAKTTCLRVVLRAMDNLDGLVRETIDDYTAQRQDGTAGVYLDKLDRRSLRRLKRGAFSIDLTGR